MSYASIPIMIIENKKNIKTKVKTDIKTKIQKPNKHKLIKIIYKSSFLF
jgi:hypothetical protein